MKFKIENEIVKAKNALTANKLVVDGIEYDICGVREEKTWCSDFLHNDF